MSNNVFHKMYVSLDHHCHPPELDADEELRHDDEDEDPGLPPQLGAVRVIQQLERLPQT